MLVAETREDDGVTGHHLRQCSIVLVAKLGECGGVGSVAGGESLGVILLELVRRRLELELPLLEDGGVLDVELVEGGDDILLPRFDEGGTLDLDSSRCLLLLVRLTLLRSFELVHLDLKSCIVVGRLELQDVGVLGRLRPKYRRILRFLLLKDLVALVQCSAEGFGVSLLELEEERRVLSRESLESALVFCDSIISERLRSM